MYVSTEKEFGNEGQFGIKIFPEDGSEDESKFLEYRHVSIHNNLMLYWFFLLIWNEKD